jgi:hypothetical protein
MVGPLHWRPAPICLPDVRKRTDTLRTWKIKEGAERHMELYSAIGGLAVVNV